MSGCVILKQGRSLIQWLCKPLGGMTLVALVLLGGCEKEKVASDGKPTVKIGFIAPLSGDNALIGRNCRNGLDMALDDLAGGDINYEVIYEDDSFKASRSVTAANKLILLDKVDFLYLCSSVTGRAVVDLAKNKEKFMMTLASAEEIALQSPYSFMHWTMPHQEGKKALEIFKKNNAKKVVFITELHPGAMALAKGAKDIAKENGVEVVSYDVLSTEKNFVDIIYKAQRENADMWFLSVFQPGIDILVKRMREQKVSVKYSASEIPGFITNKGLFEGMEYVDISDGDTDFLSRYKEKYKTSNTYLVAFAYDAMMIINNVYNDFYKNNNRLPNTKELSDNMLKVENHKGAVGLTTVDENGIINSEAVIKKIENGQVVLVEEE